MADLKKLARAEIGRPRGKYPSKTTINLLYKEKDTNKTVLTWVLFGLFLLVLAVFTKFLVIDQLQKGIVAESNYHMAEAELEALQESNRIYDEVLAEYSHYGNGYLNEEEAARQDRQAMMEVINSRVKVDSGIQSISISGNHATIVIEKTTLGEVSEVVAALEESDIVAYVAPSTAGTSEGMMTGDAADAASNTVTAQILITFASPTADAEKVDEAEGE